MRILWHNQNMRRILFTISALCLMPLSASAARTVAPAPASFSAGSSLVATSSAPGNSYAIGTSVVLTAPVMGDFLAFGGSVITASPVTGDDLILAGSISSRSSVAGDFRALGWTVDISEPIAGDLVAGGFSVHDASRAGGSVFIVAANTTLSDGALGPVTIYGNNIALVGDFAGDVTVFAGGRLSLAPGATIRGKLSYEAPDLAAIPSSAKIIGGVTYTNVSYLPDLPTSRILAFLSIGFFLIARIVGALILAGLLAGLFPAFAEVVTNRVSKSRLRGSLLALLLGFAMFVAAPIVIVLLLLTLVGSGLALLLLILYALLLLLSFVYAGIATGAMLARRFAKREIVLWHDGVIGMFLLSLVALIPFVGVVLVFLLTLLSAGTLLQIFFRFAFPHDEYVNKEL